MRPTLLLAALAPLLGCPGPEPDTGDTGDAPDVPALLDDDAYTARLQELLDLADANGGDRLATGAGESAARDWARDELEAMGWSVDEEEVVWGVPLRTTATLVATSPFGDPGAVVLMGGHLDTVYGAPGINDNGTGVAGVLGIAEALTARATAPERQVRLALYTWEEGGLLGSHGYVYSRPEAEIDALVAYVNVDMVGSPNGLPLLLDSDGSTDGQEGLVPDSQVVEDLLVEWFDAEGLPYVLQPYTSGSDFVPFVDRGIPVGSVFAGGNDLKTEEEAATFGGTAGQAYDSCYHTPCDRLDNVDVALALSLVRAAGHAVEVLADGGAL